MSNPYDTQRAANGQFGKGNPGRPRGARNTASHRAMRAILDDFTTHGATFMTALRERRPNEYVRMISRVLPKPVEDEPMLSVDCWTDKEVTEAFLDIRRLVNVETDRRMAIAGVEMILMRFR